MNSIKFNKPSFGLMMDQDWLPSRLTHWMDNLSGWDIDSKSNVPAVNVKEQTDRFIMEVSAPGFKKEELHVHIEKGTLLLKGVHEESTGDKSEKYSRREFRKSSFIRSFALPESVDGEKLSAKYENGILMIELPKKGQSVKPEPKKVEIL